MAAWLIMCSFFGVAVMMALGLAVKTTDVSPFDRRGAFFGGEKPDEEIALVVVVAAYSFGGDGGGRGRLSLPVPFPLTTRNGTCTCTRTSTGKDCTITRSSSFSRDISNSVFNGEGIVPDCGRIVLLVMRWCWCGCVCYWIGSAQEQDEGCIIDVNDGGSMWHNMMWRLESWRGPDYSQFFACRHFCLQKLDAPLFGREIVDQRTHSLLPTEYFQLPWKYDIERFPPHFITYYLIVVIT